MDAGKWSGKSAYFTFSGSEYFYFTVYFAREASGCS